MPTDCNAGQIEFEALGSRKVIAAFDGGAITSSVIPGVSQIGGSSAQIGVHPNYVRASSTITFLPLVNNTKMPRTTMPTTQTNKMALMPIAVPIVAPARSA